MICGPDDILTKPTNHNGKIANVDTPAAGIGNTANAKYMQGFFFKLFLNLYLKIVSDKFLCTN